MRMKKTTSKNRFDEITALVPDDAKDLLREVIKRMCELEEILDELGDLPKIDWNPKNKRQQRATPAAKMYKEYLQQYLNAVKVVESVIYRDKKLDGADVEDSPLREWFKNAEMER